MVAASNLRLQQSFAPIWPEMFLPTFDGMKSVLQFQFSLTFIQNPTFPWPQNKIPRHFPDLEEFVFFPDHFLTCRNHDLWKFSSRKIFYALVLDHLHSLEY